jgi:adenylate cyclase
MTIVGKLRNKLSQSFTVLRRYRYRWVMIIALVWTGLDLLLWAVRASVPQADAFADESHSRSLNYISLRSGVVFLMSLIMGYLLVFKFRTMFRNKPLQVNLLLKTVILMACSFFMNFFNLFGYFYLIQGRSLLASLKFYLHLPAEKFWLVHGLPLWILIFMITQLFIEMSEKYSPGVFADILRGKYIEPKIEKRIVMFLDLKDSTPIAESLGHKHYFLFIRDFIHFVSLAILEHGARIYQYVGDEIVVSWIYSEENSDKAVRAVIEARKVLQQQSEHFRRKYGVTPEFRVGIHAGDVTVGEIGLIKKDIAMSGDTMNTAARIRSSTSELNQKFIVSKDFYELSNLKEYQSEPLGSIELKGKSNGLELYGLKI